MTVKHSKRSMLIFGLLLLVWILSLASSRPALASPLANASECTVVSFRAAVNLSVGVLPADVDFGDFTNDNKLDLVVSNVGDNTVSLLGGDGAGGFTPRTPFTFTVGTSPYSLAVADFFAHNRMDLAVGNGWDNDIQIMRSTGTGNFDLTSHLGVGSGPSFITTSDFNRDGKPDLAVANANSNTVSILLGKATGGLNPATSFAVGTRPFSIAVGDWNKDSNPDLAVANYESNNVSILLGNGAGGFTAGTTVPASTGPTSIVVGDFNADGTLDLAVANGWSDSVTILRGNGSGGFSANASLPTDSFPYALAVADFNLDSELDLVVANTNAENVSVFLSNGLGGFGAATSFTVGSFPTSVSVRDLNGDGKPDLAVSNWASHNVSVLINNTPPCTRRTYLPWIGDQRAVVAPDLVVQNITASANNLQVTIRNQGNAPVADAFWVDLYVAPNPVPTRVNQIWNAVANQGAVWGVTAVPIPAGGTLTLSLGDAYYWAEFSNMSGTFGPGTWVYAQVDSANAQTTYGAVRETHEILQQPYNNIHGIQLGVTMTPSRVPRSPGNTPSKVMPPRPK